MAKVLNLDEMLEILKIDGDQHYHGFKAVLEATGKAMADVIADRYTISAGECRSEGTAFAGTCVCFKPSFEGQRCPEIFEEFDKGGDWEF